MAERIKQIHLILRSSDGREKRAVRFRTSIEKLRRYFIREYRGEKLSYSGFKKFVLHQCLNIKLDSRLFASVLRSCDPQSSGDITLTSFLLYAQEEFVLAIQLGLIIESASSSVFLKQPTNSEKPNLFRKQSAVSVYTHAGFSQQRLRTSFQRAFEERAIAQQAKISSSSRRRPQTALPKPRRGLLRHEITQLRGSGVLCTDGQPILSAKTIAQESWLPPCQLSTSLATSHDQQSRNNGGYFTN